MLQKELRKMPNWKVPGLDEIQECWLKGFTSQHQMLTEELNENIHSLSIPIWLVKSRTVLIKKVLAKGNAVNNYRQIACLNPLLKLKAGIISDNIKICKIKIDRRVVDMTPEALRNSCSSRDCNRRKTNLKMAWVDFRKAFDMVPHPGK